MAWGKMDDGFDEHPKVVAMLDEDDLATAGVAIGLWTLCWTWAHRNTRKRGKVPGLLPPGLPRRYLGPLAKDAAQMLVKHRLWDPQEDGGWLIHDFGDYLPTDELRAARAEAGRRGAAKRWATPETPEPDPDNPDNPPDGKLPSGAMANPMANDGSRGSRTPRHDRKPSTQPAPNTDTGASVVSRPPKPGHTSTEVDGNLPSGCHDVDSNPMASDSTRARVPPPYPFPNPSTPLPPAAARASAPPVVTLEEGEGEDQTQERTLVAEIRAKRPEWSARSITRAIRQPDVAERPWPVIAAAMHAIADDPESRAPGRVRGDGPWWSNRQATVAAPLEPPCGTCGPNRMVTRDDGRLGRCPTCHPLRPLRRAS